MERGNKEPGACGSRCAAGCGSPYEDWPLGQATALGWLLALLALLVVILFLLLMLVVLPVAFLAITFLALAAASMLWPHAATDWLAAVLAFGWTLLAVASLSGVVLYLRRVFIRRGKATPRGAG